MLAQIIVIIHQIIIVIVIQIVIKAFLLEEIQFLPLKIHGVLFYPPQKVISIYNSRTNTVWNSLQTTYNGVDACEWFVDGDYDCIADQNGNILVEY